MDVGDFLRELGLQQYEAAFRDNRIDIRVLPKLTAEDLKDLGVTMVGDRRMLLDAIAALREPTAPAVKAGGDVLDAGLIQGTEAASTAEAERRPLSVMFCDLSVPPHSRRGSIPRICGRSSALIRPASPPRSGSMTGSLRVTSVTGC